MQPNINAYNQKYWEQTFPTTKIYELVKQETDILVYEKFFNEWNTKYHPQVITPRYKLYARIWSAALFYYVQHLLDVNPKTIVDIGSGEGLLKKFIPNLVNIDETPYKDVDKVLRVDDTWLLENKNTYDCMIAINSMHFIPLENIRERVINLINIATQRGFITFNVRQLLNQSKKHVKYNRPILQNNISTEPLLKDVEAFVRTELNNLPCKILVFDLDFRFIEEGMNGNIRIVFER